MVRPDGVIDRLRERIGRYKGDYPMVSKTDIKKHLEYTDYLEEVIGDIREFHCSPDHCETYDDCIGKKCLYYLDL